MMVVLHKVEADDPGLLLALDKASLPPPDAGHYFSGEQYGALIGYGGLEGHGPHLLLRSLVVDAALQRQGMGSRLLAAMEAVAQDMGAERMHLLTITAQPFFTRHGFVLTDRAKAPSAIRETREFAGVCPGSAAYMTKEIA